MCGVRCSVLPRSGNARKGAPSDAALCACSARASSNSGSMVFSANDSPLAGRSGKAVTGRVIGQRLQQEAESSVSLKVTPVPGGTEKYEVQVSSNE